MNTTVYVIGILLQFTAAIIALLQVRRAPRKLPWLLIALSSLLIVARRAATMGEFMKTGQELAAAEVLTLIVSVFLFLGVILMSRMFQDVRVSEAHFRHLIENNHDIIYTLTADGILTFVSPGWTALLGHPVHQVTGQRFKTFIHPDDRPACNAWLNKVIETGRRQDGLEYRVRHIDGSWYWHTSSAVPLCNAAGAVTGFEGTARDITERKQAEERIGSLLAEKEIILREVHHRIKNNMNTMMSLLSMQAGTMNEPSAVEALKNAGRRMQSMRVLYEKLYHSENLREMTIGDYVPPLVHEIVKMFPAPPFAKIVTEVDDFMLGMKILPPLGIIINEIVTNAMKYAFIGRGEGVITVIASKTDNRATIVIGDDGIGIPHSVDIERSPGFGLALIGMLVTQLDGSVRIERGNGTRFVLEFNV